MLFAIGTKVRLKHTGDSGVISDILEGGMLNVYIEDQDMEIPVFEDDLVRAQDYSDTNIKAKIITTKPVQKIVKYNLPQVETPGTILKSQGLQLAFDPEHDSDGTVKKYQVFLINDTEHDFLFSLKISTPNNIGKTTHGKITATSTYLIKEMLFDELNDSPTFDIEAWKITTEGTGKKQQKALKIKAQQFFKKVKTAPLLNRPVHLYVLFDKAPQKSTTQEENLKAYTQKKVRPVRYQEADYQKYEYHDVKEYANFSGEIDLHIENLTGVIGKMGSGEKLRLQLVHFDKFIEKAIRLGVPRVFIIHGIGKGKLRNTIAGRLIQIPEVVTFKNEYHPRYGWGATEVIF